MSSIPPQFDPESFRQEGHKIIDILADYLNTAIKGGTMPVLPVRDPESLTNSFSFSSGNGENEPLGDLVKRVIDNSNHLHHPRYIGHQVTSPLPATASG